MSNLFLRRGNVVKMVIAGLMLSVASYSFATDGLEVRHQAREQNIVFVNSAKKYVLLPVENAAPEAQVYVVVDTERKSILNNVRLARNKVDLYVPLDLSQFKGEVIALEVNGVPSDAICWQNMSLSETYDMTNTERYRSLYHHTPAYGWMNDPNGMVYKDGVYHLFFQHNPYGSLWGNMHWGHSTSTDLVNWTFEGDAIAPDAWGTVFSGSAVVDKDNTAGFGAGAIVAIYASSKPTPRGECQSESIAYSTDGGKTFKKYAHNPVLTSTENDFRDPKVIWYEPGKYWVMILAVGQEMWFYTSDDLKSWSKQSSFGAGQGSHDGVWECPDLVELPVEGTKESRWVLICNINPGGPFGGSVTQYFVGTFDGKRFVNDYSSKAKWMDYGKDNYATVTWSNAPNGRCIALGWMSNWQYQNNLPTKQYRGTNTIARDLSLYKYNGELYLKSAPAKEMLAARKHKDSVDAFTVNANDTDNFYTFAPYDGAYEIEMTLSCDKGKSVGFSLGNWQGEKVDFCMDMAANEFTMDRTKSGDTSFSDDFLIVTKAPLNSKGDQTLRIFVDRSSIEVFGNEGKFVMSNRVFPSSPYSELTFKSNVGTTKVKRLNKYTLTKTELTENIK